jgi:hypothetical protein
MGVCKSEGSVMLVQEYVSGGSLHRILQNKSIELLWPTRVKMALEIAQALLFLHSRNVLHRDLKAENVLIEVAPDQVAGTHSFGRCKLADFGLSTLFNGKAMSEVGTPLWRAPELSSHMYGPAADVFSFGVVMFELLTRAHGDDIRPGMTLVRKLEFATNTELLRSDAQFVKEIEWCPPDYWRLASQCCNDNPDLRPTTQAIVDQLQALSDRLHDLASFAFKMLKGYDVSLASAETHDDVLETQVQSPFKMWVAAATTQLAVDSDVTKLTVPCEVIVNLIAQRASHLTGKPMDNDSKEFLCSVMNLSATARISIDQFGALWRWYSITEHMLLHPLILPHFQDGFIHGFITSDLALQMLGEKEGHLIIRFSGTKPGCLVIMCYHDGRPIQVLVGFEYLETPANGCFVLGTARCCTLRQILSRNNLGMLKFVHPGIPIDDEQFLSAFQKTSLVVEQSQSSVDTASTTRYDIDIDRNMLSNQ